MPRRILANLLLGLALAVLAPGAAFDATLPAAVEGQPLPTLAPMLKRATPAVVNIATRGRRRMQDNPLFSDPFFRRFFNLPEAPPARRTLSVGSGVIVDAARGYVLTNHHVVADAEQIVVTLRDRRRFAAELVGADRETDVAVLRITADGLTALPIGDSDALEVGDFVVAIGNPFGIGQTVTSGIVSALRRSGLGIEGFEDFIQTDASINPGNSGGALVTLRGELIGINTAILGPSGGNVGIGFAIPIDMARRVMEQLVAHGEVRRGRLGLHARDLTPDLAESLGVGSDEGAVVTRVVRRSPAATAGLEAGDVVVGMAGAPVRSATDLRNKIGLLRIGETVELTILRDAREMTIRTEVEEPVRLRIESGGAMRRLAGATFGPLDADSPQFGRIEGVRVVDVERRSPAWRTGLRKDDVVVAINRQPVSTLDELRAAAGTGGGGLVLNIMRGEAQVFIVVR